MPILSFISSIFVVRKSENHAIYLAMNIAFYSTQSYDREYFDSMNNKQHHIGYFETSLNADTARLAKGFEAICVFVNDKVTPSVLEVLSEYGIKIIALRCAGFNNVDVKKASELGIKVVRVPAYSPHAVAEHAVAMILTLNRKTHKAYNRVREGNFSLERLTGFDLYGKTVGVIGTGQIGQVFCTIMQGFGCQILAYDKFPNKDLSQKGITYTTLEELLMQSDIISLHCPLTIETQYLIRTETLDLMKQGAMLINTGRGGLVDTKSVIKALKKGHLGYLGIDVYEQEEHIFFRNLSESIIQDETLLRLLSFPNVLITSHQGFFTHEALTQIAKITLHNIETFESHLPLVNEVIV